MKTHQPNPKHEPRTVQVAHKLIEEVIGKKIVHGLGIWKGFRFQKR